MILWFLRDYYSDNLRYSTIGEDVLQYVTNNNYLWLNI